jgi:hypothetical protein
VLGSILGGKGVNSRLNLFFVSLQIGGGFGREEREKEIQGLFE